MFLFIFVRLAEWSKAVGLSPITFESAGSNPVPNNNFSHFLHRMSIRPALDWRGPTRDW